MSHSLRLNLQKKYYKNIDKSYSDGLSIEEELKLYNEYQLTLENFIKDCDKILSNEKLKKDCQLNYRQVGAYQRMILNYPDTGWSHRNQQLSQAYKELMCDFIFYNENIEYEELTITEIEIMKYMAKFLIDKADELKIQCNLEKILADVRD